MTAGNVVGRVTLVQAQNLLLQHAIDHLHAFDPVRERKHILLCRLK
jgi:hypothetical protein